MLATLAVLAFLIDQVQEHNCPQCRQALAGRKRRLHLWQKLRSMFVELLIPDWPALWTAMAKGYERTTPKILDGYWPKNRSRHSGPATAGGGGLAARSRSP